MSLLLRALAGLASLLTRDLHFLDCQFKLDPAADQPLYPTIATHLHRITQEAMHNVVRHARADWACGTQVRVACPLGAMQQAQRAATATTQREPQVEE